PEVGKPHSAVFEVAQPIRAEGGVVLSVTLDFRSQWPQHHLGRFRLAVTPAPNPHGVHTLPAPVRAILAVAPEERTDQQRSELRSYYRAHFAPEIRQLNELLAKLRQEQAELDKQIPTTMVMEEMPRPRDTFLLIRGQYDKKGPPVRAGVPAFLPPP